MCTTLQKAGSVWKSHSWLVDQFKYLPLPNTQYSNKVLKVIVLQNIFRVINE